MIEVLYTTYIGNGGDTKEVVIAQDISYIFILEYRIDPDKKYTSNTIETRGYKSKSEVTSRGYDQT